MTVAATVIQDSIGYHGAPRLTTMQVTMHRFVLAEFNTHRAFSRNFRSSRAVPVAKLLQEVRENPAMPVSWQANKPGMQGGAEITGDNLRMIEGTWREAAVCAANCAEKMAELGLHKSVANRPLEPFLYVHGVVTATEWRNFFDLRCHPDAQPEIRVLAQCMMQALESSEPVKRKAHDPHAPYVSDAERDRYRAETLMLLSAARCARVSYKMHDGSEPDFDADMTLANKLRGAEPGHMSPFEHQGYPDTLEQARPVWWRRPKDHRNFVGWRQHRAIIEAESPF